jgi:hypothetical protein
MTTAQQPAGPVPMAPPYQFGVHERLSVLVHADAKVGKSTLAATMPKPVCVLDAEGSWRFTSGRKVFWNPLSEAPPVYDGSWDICVVHVQNWMTVEVVLNAVRAGHFQVVSLALDSITVLQKKLKENLKGTEAMQIQDWGNLLTRMDAVLGGVRDMCLIPELSIRCVMFVAETALVDGKWRPAMQGQIARSLPYMVDICGYLYQYKQLGEDGQPTVDQRHLWIGLHDQFVSGSRVTERLGQVVLVPPPPPGQTGSVIEDWMKTLFVPQPQPVAAPTHQEIQS